VAEVLVTGGAGFIGNNLARHLIRKGHTVHLVLKEEYAEWRLRDLRNHAAIYTVDLLDFEKINRVVQQIRPEWVFHMAAHGQYSSQTDVFRILQTNVIGTANLVLACLKTGFEVFVNTGSSSEYGLKDHPPNEKELPDPNSYYATAKASATMFCRYTARKHGVRIPTLRLYSVYGPYEEPGRFIPTLILKGLAGKLPPLVNPLVVRDFVFTEDAIEAYMLAATIIVAEPGPIYNVGAGTQTTIEQAVAIARKTLDIREEPCWDSMPNRIWDTETWVCDNSRIRDELGWAPRHSFEQGFSKTVKWFIDNLVFVSIYDLQSSDCH